MSTFYICTLLLSSDVYSRYVAYFTFFLIPLHFIWYRCKCNMHNWITTTIYHIQVYYHHPSIPLLHNFHCLLQPLPTIMGTVFSFFHCLPSLRNIPLFLPTSAIVWEMLLTTFCFSQQLNHHHMRCIDLLHPIFFLLLGQHCPSWGKMQPACSKCHLPPVPTITFFSLLFQLRTGVGRMVGRSMPRSGSIPQIQPWQYVPVSPPTAVQQMPVSYVVLST